MLRYVPKCVNGRAHPPPAREPRHGHHLSVAPNEPFRPGIGSATAEPGVVPPGISPAACAAPGTTPTRASARTAVTPRERKNDGRDAEMVAMTGLPSRRGVRPGVDALWAIPAHPR